MAAFRLRHKFAFRFTLNSLERLGLALARLTVPFLPADIRSRDTNSTPEGTKGTGCAEDMRCTVRVTVVVPCNSPDDSGVLATFLSGQVEGAAPPTRGVGKLEIRAGSPGSQEPDASSSTASFTTSPQGADCSLAKHSLPVPRAVNHSKRPRLISETLRERNFDSCFPSSLHFRQERGLID